MRCFASVALLMGFFFLDSQLFSQTAPKGKQPPKGKKVESLAGFKKQIIDGFTVMLHEDVLKEQEDSKYKRKPVDALEIELKLISKVMTKQQADTIRGNVQIWVEWNTREALTNGRAGMAAGLYMGIHPRPFLAKGKEPIYLSGVRILQMEYITKRHQSDDAADSVLLHEFAHAFHDLVIGYEYPPVIEAYKQAMERKLYDKSLYAATNEKEFFAELTCAFLDKLDYFPRNREELKKHDAVAYKLMESIWGRKKDAKTGPKDLAKTIDLELKGLTLGQPIGSTSLKLDDLNGRTVMLVFWVPTLADTPTLLKKATAWSEELDDFGLSVVTEVGWGIPRTFVKLETTAINAHIYHNAPALPHFANGTLAKLDDHKMPYAVVFDAKGQGLFRGSPYEAEAVMRAAVGRTLIDAAGIEKFAPSVAPLADALRNGQPPFPLLQKLIGVYQNSPGAASEQAKALIGLLTANAKKRLEEASALKSSEPFKAFESLERLASVYKNTQVGVKATALVNQLKSDKDVAAELRARPSLQAIKKIETSLNGRAGSFNPADPSFQLDNADLLEQLRVAIGKMKKAYPKTKALDDAIMLGTRFAVDVK